MTRDLVGVTAGVPPVAGMPARAGASPGASAAASTAASAPARASAAVAGSRIEWVQGQARTAGVPLDVDEALQGLYQVAQTVSNAVSKRSAHPGIGNGAATGIGSYIFSGVIGVPVAFFSVLAIRGGWSEIVETRARAAMLRRELSRRENAREAALGPVLERQDDAARREWVVHDQACDDLVAERTRNRSAAGIGFSACAAGTTMLLRTAADAALQVGLAIAAKGFNVASVLAASPLAATLSAVVGTVGAVVLSPLAGVLATLLGGFFVHQSRTGCQRLGKDGQRVRAALARRAKSRTVQNYRDYVLRKVRKRHRFLLRFRNWNAAFLTGGLLFGGAATVKAAIGVAAVVGIGVGVVATSGGLLVLLLIGTLGALLLGIASVPFITQGGKNKRHQTQYAGDHPQVDRHRLAPLDLLVDARVGPAEPDGASDAPADGAGVALRSKLYGSIVERKRALSNLLVAAAKGLGHHVRRRHHPDPLDAGMRIGKIQRDAWGFGRSRVRRMARACRAFLRALAIGKGFAAARFEARTTYRNGAPEARLASWLNTSDGLSAQHAFMLASLKAQQGYLHAKLEIMRQAVKRCPDAVAGTDASEAVLALRDAAPNLGEDYAQAIGEEERTIQAVEALLKDVQDAGPESAVAAQAWALRYVQLQGLDAGSEGRLPPAGHLFAGFCLEALPRQLAEMAGVLVGTELHAARIDHRMRLERISY